MDHSPQPPPLDKPRLAALTLRAALVLAAGLVLAGVALGLRGCRPGAEREPADAPAAQRAADPRLSYRGPFRNVHPGVAYVGDGACAGCHSYEAEVYARHPMGRSLAPIREVVDQPPHAGPGAFAALGSLFRVERRGQHVWHQQKRLDDAGRPLFTLEQEARYVIGSGTRGYSYLSQRDGFLFQTPISWFSQKRVWDLSPAFTSESLSGRPIPPGCLFCHANRTHHRPGTVNGYRKPVFEGHAIGCERCHGPGELHVRERKETWLAGGDVDTSIVAPGKLSPPLRDAVCQQCHLTSEPRVLPRGREVDDFRPGLPLEVFLSVFVRASAASGRKAVNHVEQMYQSRCFRAGSEEKRLGCISCHDPHQRVAAARRVEHYRRRCLECHARRGCREPQEVRLRQNPQDSCIDCHMPRYTSSDIAHTAGTDHRILRRPERRDERPAVERMAVWRSGAGAVLPGDAPGPELARDLGIALAGLAEGGKGEPAAFARRAVGLLEEGLGHFPDDVPAWEARGQALGVLGRRDEALAACQEALRLAPRRESTLARAARLAQDRGLLDKALEYWRQAVAVNPQAPAYRGNLAALLAHAREWDEARRHCRVWLSLDPGSREARQLWVRCLFQQGDRAGARSEMDKLRRMR